jgi:hypothetical protein
MLKFFTAALCFIIFASTQEPASAKFRAMKDCDNDGLAQCLSDVENDFWGCEKDCQKQFPDDPPGYHDCRDQCREIHDGVRQECFKQYCPSVMQKFTKRPK